MGNWVETPEEHRDRSLRRQLLRRAIWRMEARKAKPVSLAVAKNLCRAGYGWEDIAVRTGISSEQCRLLVIRERHDLRVAP